VRSTVPERWTTSKRAVAIRARLLEHPGRAGLAKDCLYAVAVEARARSCSIAAPITTIRIPRR